MKATVFVRLKADILDPQGKAVQGILQTLGYKGVRKVRVGKLIEIELDGAMNGEMKAQLQEMATRVLSNPVIESVELKLNQPGDRP
jgi:phosphoribosylformylglycinamidine synthase PurS subunit